MWPFYTSLYAPLHLVELYYTTLHDFCFCKSSQNPFASLKCHDCTVSHNSFFTLSKFSSVSWWNSWSKIIHIPLWAKSTVAKVSGLMLLGVAPSSPSSSPGAVTFQPVASQPFSVIDQYLPVRVVLSLGECSFQCSSCELTHFLLHLFDHVYADFPFLPIHRFIGPSRSQDVRILWPSKLICFNTAAMLRKGLISWLAVLLVI